MADHDINGYVDTGTYSWLLVDICNWNSYGLICGYWRLFVAGHHLTETSIHG